MGITHHRYLYYLLGLFSIEWIYLAIKPWHFNDWLLENVLVIVGIAVLWLTHKKFPLSRVSYTLLFIFLALHAIGAHFTYAEVPYDAWIQSNFGFSLNESMGWERNHFDRLVHFSYGLLLAYPIREVFQRVVGVRGFWGYFLPLDLTMSTSMLYELVEWAVVGVFGGDLGMAYLGTQGDIWDAHKDMGLASLGALIAMTCTAGINISLQRDFAEEWNESLRVKINRPLGEDEIARMINNQQD
ncbi:MAG: DUF2238 domain-containing protein [Gammaproteobacteria bacterium]